MRALVTRDIYAGDGNIRSGCILGEVQAVFSTILPIYEACQGDSANQVEDITARVAKEIVAAVCGDVEGILVDPTDQIIEAEENQIMAGLNIIDIAVAAVQFPGGSAVGASQGISADTARADIDQVDIIERPDDARTSACESVIRL